VGQGDPEEAIAGAQFRSFLEEAAKNIDLLTQGQVLLLEFGP
jgi:hypothetical protein